MEEQKSDQQQNQSYQIPQFGQQNQTIKKQQKRAKLSAHEQAVMATSNDALVTKVYAAQLGYFEDNYAKLFLQNKRKMLPIINRGTWTRVQSYRQLIIKFLDSFCQQGKKVNIISLGAGYDTTVFWLSQTQNGKYSQWMQDLVTYVEIDYEQVVNRKIEILKQNNELWSFCKNNVNPQSSSDINSQNYKLLAQDVKKTDELTEVLRKEYNVDDSLPTLILTECLLIYLKPQDSINILKWTSEYFKNSDFLAILNYEMIEPFDLFGQTMVNNLRDRGCDLLGIEGCPNLESQKERMKQALKIEDESSKKVFVETITMNEVYQERLDPIEKQRIDRLEIFDEFEEWNLLQSHYCLCFAKRYQEDQGINVFI